MKPKLFAKFCLIITTSALLMISAACSGQPRGQTQDRKQPPEEVNKLLKQVDAGQEKRRAVEAEYKSLPLPELIKRLQDDSVKGIEPFNSLAYREAVSRGPGVGKELGGSIKAADRSSFFALAAVRKTNKAAYDALDPRLRTAVLVDALRNSKHFNTWGLPHLYWEDSAKAIVELGQSAVEPLKSLLQEKRAAPVWGSEEAMEYQKYQYRVCDYAWALLMQIEGKKIEIPIEPARRDQLIAGNQ